MRTKLIVATTAGVLSLTGLAVAAPALAAPSGTTEAASSAVDRVRNALAGLVGDGSITQEQADEVAGTLAEAGLGGHAHGHGGPGGRLDLGAAATALGLGEEELRTALEEEGTTLADVAEQQGVAVEILVEALVEAGQERIAQAVEDGRSTQEEADERLADLEERITERVESAGPGWGPGGHGHHGPRGAAASPPAPSEGSRP